MASVESPADIQWYWMRFIKTHQIPLNVQLAQFRNAPENGGYRRYITHRLLFELNSKGNNIIYCSNFKFQKYMLSRKVPIKRHVTRHMKKSNYSIALVWEVAFELPLLPPSDFNSTIVVKMSSY